MNSFIILQVIASAALIKIAYCAPAGGWSILEYGPGYNTYGHQQMKAARLRGVTPIVDTIREEEKYGNDGGQIRSVSNAFIKTSEGVSAAVSNILGKPNDNTFNLLKPFDPFFTDIGNRLGGIA